MLRFAFAGRVSTEDHQDEEASRGWPISGARQLIEPYGGVIVAEFFARVLPLPALVASASGGASTSRAGYTEPRVGGSARRRGRTACYGNQFRLTFPTITHYGVELWVPEVEGPVARDSEAHETMMSLFGGMSGRTEPHQIGRPDGHARYDRTGGSLPGGSSAVWLPAS
jgi:hypothetical protein